MATFGGVRPVKLPGFFLKKREKTAIRAPKKKGSSESTDEPSCL